MLLRHHTNDVAIDSLAVAALLVLLSLSLMVTSLCSGNHVGSRCSEHLLKHYYKNYCSFSLSCAGKSLLKLYFYPKIN